MHLSPYVVLALYALAVMRVTGLITADQVTAGIRAKVVIWLMREPRAGWRNELLYLVTCAWCVSIYVGTAAAVLWYTVGTNPVLLVGAIALAFSQLAGMFSDVGRG